MEGALTAMGSKEMDLQKALVECGVRLLLAGHVDACLGMAERWARNADQSVVRHMVRRLLAVCAPPYSPTFALALVRYAPSHVTLASVCESHAPFFEHHASFWERHFFCVTYVLCEGHTSFCERYVPCVTYVLCEVIRPSL